MRFLAKIKYTVYGLLAVMSINALTSCIDEAVMSQPAADDTNTAVLRLSTSSTVSRGDSHYGDDPYAEQPEAKI